MNQRIAILLLLILGLLQMCADLCGLSAIKAIAASTGASPAPKVFSAVRGLETFSSRFYIEWDDTAGEVHSMEITSERNGGILGPYNRRNVFGAALAYGPVLSSNEHTEAMFRDVSRYAFCGAAPLLQELGIDAERIQGSLRIKVVPQGRSEPESDLPMSLAIDCD